MKKIGECNRCGDCCKGSVLFADIKKTLKTFLHQDFTEDIKSFRCPFLKDLPDGMTKCEIWEERPDFCRKFPANPEHLKLVSRCSYKFVEEG